MQHLQGFPLKPVAGGNPPFAVASSAGYFTDKNINSKRKKYLFQMFTGSRETYFRKVAVTINKDEKSVFIYLGLNIVHMNSGH